jgi:uncharacterized membrane protein
MADRNRFRFIDEFRGLIGIMMALGHSGEYLNALWKSFDMVDPCFPDGGQFALRYMGYLCAPGFLMMNGAMTYWTFKRRRAAGETPAQARWDLVQRGLFLVLVQWIWVNAAWGGFARLRLDHLGIIATIGMTMLLLAPLAAWPWWARLIPAVAITVVHPLLLRIPYDTTGWQKYPMQLFVTSGDFNLYPVLPWFALGATGSVMAYFWFERWREPGLRTRRSLALGAGLVLLAWALRLWGGDYANIFPSGPFLSWSFFLVQKYPPQLTHQLWFAGAVIFMVGVFSWLSERTRLTHWLGVVGRVPLFFYAVHIPLLALATRRLGVPYREWGVLGSLLGWLCLLAIMLPLAWWFGGVKRRSKSWFVRMI